MHAAEDDSPARSGARGAGAPRPGERRRRRRADARLLREIGNTLPLLVWAADALGEPFYFNRRWYEYTGLTEEASVGHGFLAAVHPDDRERTRDVWARAWQTGAPYRIEYRLLAADGSHRWFAGAGDPVRDPATGDVAYWVGTCADVHERRQFEDELRASEARFRAVQETTPDGFMVFESVRDGDGGPIRDFRWAYVNDAAARIVGRPRDWFAGRLLLEEMPGNREEGLFDSYARVVETGETWNGELTYARDGLDLFLRVTAAKVGDGFAVSFADLSARRHAERALEENERRLRAVFDQQFQFLALLAPDGTLLQVNDLPLRAAGIARADVIGRKFWDTPWWDGLPEMRAAWPGRLAEAAASDGPVLTEDRFRAADGTARVADCAVTAIRRRDGSVEMFLVQASDVTDRRAAEEAVRAARQELQIVADAAPVALAHVDRDRRFLFVNREYAARFGLTPEQVVGRTIPEVIGAEPFSRFSEYVDAVLAGAGPQEFEVALTLPVIGDRYLHSHYAPRHAPDGTVESFVAVIVDISERRRAENALRASEERYRSLFESIDEGFCVIEVLFDDAADPDRATDYRFLEVNPAFERHTGLRDAVGKRMREFVPDYDDHWFAAFGRVARTGEPERFDNGAPALGRWFDVYAFRVGRPEECKVAVLFNDITERRRVEAALRESEERYRSLFESIDEGFCVVEVLFDDPGDAERATDYRFLIVNPMFERQTGLVAPTGRTARELVPALEPEWFAVYGKVARSGEPERFQLGSEAMGRWFDVYAFRVGLPEECRVAILFRDVTEQRRAESALRESEERSRAILESITDAFFALDADWRFTYLNSHAERLLAAGPGGLTGRSLWEAFPGLRGSEFEAAYRAAAAEGVARSVTAYYPDHGRWYEVRAYPAPGGGGITVYFRDVTARRAAEDALRESEARFRALADNISQLAWMADETGAIFWYNRRWFDYTGMTPEELDAGPEASRSRVHPDHVERVADSYHATFAEGREWEETFPLRGADGSYRWFLTRAVPIRGDDGRVARWFGTNTDVTEQREAARRAAFLAELSARLRAVGDDPDAVIAETLRLCGGFLGADRVGFVDVDADAERIVVHPDWTSARYDGPSAVGEWDLKPVKDALMAELEKGRSVAVEDITDHPLVGAANRAGMAALGVRALVNVPLCDAENRWVGVLAVNQSAPRAWTPEEVALLEAVAERARVAREGALLARRERDLALKNARIAQTLQTSLLSEPAEDAFPGIRLKTVYEAAWEEAALGGDFFDAFVVDPCPDGAGGGSRLALVVGDVAGKGLEAAAYTAEVKFSLRALLREHGDPARALTALNRLLLVSDVPRLVALCVAVLDPDTGEVRVASGGAEPPLIVGGPDAGCASREVSVEGGPMIGVDVAVEYEAATARVAPGELLLLFTDGITEARSGRSFFGPEGVAAAARDALFAESPGSSAADVAPVAAAVVASARAFAGGALRDDACLLVARRNPAG